MATSPASGPGGGGGSAPQTGSGPPTGVVTPASIGGFYVDTTNGALYSASGLTSADWLVVGGQAFDFGSAVGVSWRTNELMILGGVDRDTPLFGAGVILSDAYTQWNGSGAGLKVVGNGTDGQQVLRFENAAGAFNIVDQNGTLRTGAGGLALVSSDPHISGAWWDNAGTLTRSSG